MSQFVSFRFERINAGGCHIGAANSLDLLDGAKLFIIEDLIEIDNDFIEQTNAFNAFVDILRVKFREVWDGSKQNAGVVASFFFWNRKKKSKYFLI